MGRGGGVTADLYHLLLAGLPAHSIKSIAKVIDPERQEVLHCVAGYRIECVLPDLYLMAIPSPHFWEQCFDVASRCLGNSEWANLANLILMLIDHLRDLVPAHPGSLIGHTGAFSAGSTSACFTLFPDSRR